VAYLHTGVVLKVNVFFCSTAQARRRFCEVLGCIFWWDGFCWFFVLFM